MPAKVYTVLCMFSCLSVFVLRFILFYFNLLSEMNAKEMRNRLNSSVVEFLSKEGNEALACEVLGDPNPDETTTYSYLGSDLFKEEYSEYRHPSRHWIRFYAREDIHRKLSEINFGRRWPNCLSLTILDDLTIVVEAR